MGEIRKTWPDAAEALLTKLWTAGASANEVRAELSRALHFDVSRNAVIGKVHRLGLTVTAPRHHHRSSVPHQPRRPALRPEPKTPARILAPPRLVVAPTPIPDIEPLAKVGAFWPATDTAKTMLDLGRCECKFPVGEASGMEQLHCAAKTEPNQVYCSDHKRLVSKPRVDNLVAKSGRLPLWATQ